MIDLDYDKISEYIRGSYFRESQDFKIAIEQMEQYRDLQIQLMILKSQETSDFINTVNSGIASTFNTLDTRNLSSLEGSNVVCCEKIEHDSKSYAEDTSSNKDIKNKSVFECFKEFVYALVENLNDIIDYIITWLY